MAKIRVVIKRLQFYGLPLVELEPPLIFQYIIQIMEGTKIEVKVKEIVGWYVKISDA